MINKTYQTILFTTRVSQIPFNVKTMLSLFHSDYLIGFGIPIIPMSIDL